ncbi:hypothetical protein FOMG_19899 [Fusarium oxysporum f. sp. melonis 26406]|uniref:Uncharacterized protein n=1 Tax=Fusarium oxysporum f. sp. melonis 26406 TaxID=1089452 RepID=W9YVV9_FUSOX|nr:hypothetical protein FOMG_19899 [Fusarium oxysporum f. sp. melonis 26406]
MGELISEVHATKLGIDEDELVNRVKYRVLITSRRVYLGTCRRMIDDLVMDQTYEAMTPVEFKRSRQAF